MEGLRNRDEVKNDPKGKSVWETCSNRQAANREVVRSNDSFLVEPGGEVQMLGRLLRGRAGTNFWGVAASVWPLSSSTSVLLRQKYRRLGSDESHS